jgi:hypothetical protein
MKGMRDLQERERGKTADSRRTVRRIIVPGTRAALIINQTRWR